MKELSEYLLSIYRIHFPQQKFENKSKKLLTSAEYATTIHVLKHAWSFKIVFSGI